MTLHSDTLQKLAYCIDNTSGNTRLYSMEEIVPMDQKHQDKLIDIRETYGMTNGALYRMDDYLKSI